MRLTVGKQVAWWGGGGAVLLLVLWGLGNTITPFLVGAGIAYILDPIADRFERSGLSRTLSVALITVLAVMLFIIGILLIFPMIIRQATQLVSAAPEYFEALRVFVSNRFPGLLPADGTVTGIFEEAAQRISDLAGTALPALLNSVSSVISVIVLLLIVPVVAFYLLLDWDNMIAEIDHLLPREHAETIRALASQVDHSLSGFLRGQGLVTLILGTFYSIGLFAVSLPYGLVIGIVAAVLSIIPYVGVFVGGLTAIGVALFHFWGDPLSIGAVAAIFVVGQMLEGNVLQPKIVGGHVGLHPVWLMFALAVFGSIFGFVGLIVAVPLAAMIGVLARFAVGRYRESALYTGRAPAPVIATPQLIELVPPGTVEAIRREAAIESEKAIGEVKLEEAREEALEAAKKAAEKSGDHVAVARIEVRKPGAAAQLDDKPKPEVMTFPGELEEAAHAAGIPDSEIPHPPKD